MKFGDFPKISIEIEREKGHIIRSHLALSDAFRCINGSEPIWEWLSLYLQKKKILSPCAPEGTSFQREVMQALQQIPFGKTVSYRELAIFCKKPKGARAIGNACHRNAFPLLIPCHRVIRSSGHLGGFAVDLEIKRRLLEFEKE